MNENETIEKVKKVERWQCTRCGVLHVYEDTAIRCASHHDLHDRVSDAFREGKTLKWINDTFDLKWNLTDEQGSITKDSCFVMEHYQLCKKPAYRIVDVNPYGIVELGGIGGFMGYFSGTETIKRLPTSHPKEELFVYSRS